MSVEPEIDRLFVAKAMAWAVTLGQTRTEHPSMDAYWNSLREHVQNYWLSMVDGLLRYRAIHGNNL